MDVSHVRRVCVIGAGVSGLAAVKSCLEEGLEPVCYERDEHLGGLWNYHRDYAHGERGGALFESLVTNSSKEMMCFSDFPFPEDAPPYLAARSVMSYYQNYAEHFKLLPHIHFNTEVIRVVQTEDFDKTGRWLVTILQNEEESDHMFDAVMLATGFFGAPNQPTYPGEEEFQGSVIHSNQYRTNDGYRGKHVVGGSHSAGDIAVDISLTAKQVYISMRNGTWIVSRIGPRALPYEMSVVRRINYLKPAWYWRYELQRNIPSLDEASLDTLGLRSERKLFHTSLMINDVIQSRVQCGAIKAKPGIDHFNRRGLVFTDGTTVEADVVVYATGYKMKVPFMDPSIVQETLRDLELYKSVFPPRLRNPTCACIGFIMAFGANGPAFEMQFPPVPYSDDLAAKIGALPTFRELIFTDPLMAFYTIFGPAAPYLYRLLGPHRWDGARDAYLSLWDKYRKATRTREVKKPLMTWQPIQYVVVMMAMLAAVFLVTL